MAKETRSDRIYRWLLRLFPFDFQREYGADMHAVFRDERRETDGVMDDMWRLSPSGEITPHPDPPPQGGRGFRLYRGRRCHQLDASSVRSDIET